MSIYLGTVKMSGSAGIAGGDAAVIASNITLSTTAQPYITINNSSKTIALPATDPYTSARTPASHTHGQLTNAGAITSTAVALASGDSLVFVDSSDSNKVKKSSITFGNSTTTFLRNDGQWATPSGGGGGVSTHTLLSSDVHTDTTTGSPTNGNIIVGNGSKWTSQSFETFANTYHAVPLVGHFDTTNFNAWFQACLTGVTNSQMFYDNFEAVHDANPSLNWITIDISISDIISAITSGRPVYMLGTATIDGLADFKFVFQPNVDIANGGTTHGIIFSSSCGYDFIGGIDVTYQTDVDGNGNPGGGLIILPRLTGENVAKIEALPSDSGAIAYKSIITGSSTTTFLRNDGQWATPSGGGGGTADGNYYPTAVTWLSGVAAGPKPKLTMVGVEDITGDSIPPASSSASGIVTARAQTFAGVKTFASSPKLSTNAITTNSGYTQTFPDATGTIVNGTGTSGYITKWSGTNTVTIGPQFGNSTTTFLRNDGTWATPSGGGGGGTSLEFYFDQNYENLRTQSGGRVIFDLNTIGGQRSFSELKVGSDLYNQYFSNDPVAVTLILADGYEQHENYVLINNDTTSNDLRVSLADFSIRPANSVSNITATHVSLDNNFDIAGETIPAGYSGLYSLVYNGLSLIVSFAGLFENLE